MSSKITNISKKLPEPGYDHFRPIKDKVVVRAIDDTTGNGTPGASTLFLNGMKAIQMELPDDYGLCEIVSCGPDVKNLVPGMRTVIALHESIQQILIQSKTYYIVEASGDWHPFTNYVNDNGELRPLPDMVMTVAAPERMGVAMTGVHPDIIKLPDWQTTSGIACRWRTTDEIVKKAEQVLGIPEGVNYRVILGLAKRPKNMTREMAHCTYEEVVALGSDVQDCGLQEKDLVPVIVERATLIHMGGKRYRFSYPDNIGLSIDDAAILESIPRSA